jgi:hypothetical protein
MQEFVKNYGGTTLATPRTCQLIVEFVPIDFQPEDQDALRRIEEASGMPTASVCKACWIKPAHLRNEGQKKVRILNSGGVISGGCEPCPGVRNYH